MIRTNIENIAYEYLCVCVCGLFKLYTRIFKIYFVRRTGVCKSNSLSADTIGILPDL